MAEEEVKDPGRESKNESMTPSNKEEEEVEEETKTMTPWEQHASVISIPRFDYNAPSYLLQRSHSGFLITCTIKREKSATKEAMSILGKYVGFGSLNDDNSKSSESSDTTLSAKKRKLCTDEMDGKSANGIKSEVSAEEAGEISEDDSLASSNKNTNTERDFLLSLVKLTGSGLLLLTFPSENSPDTVDILSNIFQSMESGCLKSPLWCHRIFPIQATCNLNEKELKATVSKCVLEFVNDKQNKMLRPVKFAVGYNRRGIEEGQMKSSKDLEKSALLNRNKCFEVVASAIKDSLSDSVVDLKSPELCVLVELLPISGVSTGSVVVAVSVLPQNLVSTKPRLCVKPLVSDVKARNGKS
ncbi:uncharacterized protein LOC110823607 isoform X2 [Carica papaya]|uniref:uncharacterized protein LOC110823607 isoform X2 n=1 Tax=Carica papaya TaxID=3649 RepID=UPI000B8C9877|nr:uncharacterized protein LOC110823607 isoform X2 [Carica papaya]